MFSIIYGGEGGIRTHGTQKVQRFSRSIARSTRGKNALNPFFIQSISVIFRIQRPCALSVHVGTALISISGKTCGREWMAPFTVALDAGVMVITSLAATIHSIDLIVFDTIV